MRRLVHVVRSDAFAGAERYIALAARGLADRGWHVTVVGGGVEAMREALSPIPHVPAPTTAAAMRALARQGRVDIVHAHLTAGEIAAMLTKPLTQARLVSTRHIAAQRGSSRLARLVAPAIRRSLAVQIAPSQYVAAATKEPCVVIPHGVAPGGGSAADRDRIVVVLQRFEPEKATDVAIRAWALSGLAERGFRLVVAGRGAQAQHLQALALSLGVASSVDFPGFVDDPRGLLRRAMVVLAPTPVEAFGFTVCEAMAEATPVVAAGAGAYPELLGSDGLVFPAGDSAAAAALIRKVALEPDLGLAYGLRLQQRQRAVFSIQHHLDGLEATYRQVLAGSRSLVP